MASALLDAPVAAVADTVAVCDLLLRYHSVRELTEELCRPLCAEDCVAQSMPDASPAKWHLAHTSWFFETFLLERMQEDYQPVHPQYGYLFNSYYNAVGERVPRSQRGLLTRPTLAETYDYRARIDEQMAELLTHPLPDDIAAIVELGLNHEQQHQELILTDIKHLFSLNPLRPAYRLRDAEPDCCKQARRLEWWESDGGLIDVGHDGCGFAFDNESPRHRTFLRPFALATRLVTSGEYLEFVEDGGYERPEFWLSDGWDAVRQHGWEAPLYWRRAGNDWRTFTLGGERPLSPAQPVCHVSYYEADAFARWSGARLPIEAEWESVAASQPLGGNLLESGRLHPAAAQMQHFDSPAQMFGDVWEWTASPYTPYPGYQPAAGALGEYNGKFMCNQFVLRGGSCVTPPGHIRATYRNFFGPATRWQFIGIRLAKDLD
jgi:ergothioneine biosynthesis protein EgtB